MKVENIHWWIIAIISSFFSVLAYAIILEYPKYSTYVLIFILTFIVVSLLNPIRRYYKAAWTAMTIAVSRSFIINFNLFEEEPNIYGLKKVSYDLMVGSEDHFVSIVLGAISIFCFYLDYHIRSIDSSDRNKKYEGQITFQIIQGWTLEWTIRTLVKAKNSVCEFINFDQNDLNTMLNEHPIKANDLQDALEKIQFLQTDIPKYRVTINSSNVYQIIKK